jgi:hypothetical protein
MIATIDNIRDFETLRPPAGVADSLRHKPFRDCKKHRREHAHDQAVRC